MTWTLEVGELLPWFSQRDRHGQGESSSPAPSSRATRRYEALRAYLHEGMSAAEVARRFGYAPDTLQVVVAVALALALHRDSDSVTTFNKFGQRYQDPANGPWTQRDPAPLSGGADSYAFLGDNPPNRVDPTGGFPVRWHWWGATVYLNHTWTTRVAFGLAGVSAVATLLILIPVIGEILAAAVIAVAGALAAYAGYLVTEHRCLLLNCTWGGDLWPGSYVGGRTCPR